VPRMLDVSDDVRAEIGDEEADRLIAGENVPGTYDCTSCRAPGDAERERTSTVLFVGDETAVLAFAHATCVPSQVIPVSEDQLQKVVRSITGESQEAATAAPSVGTPANPGSEQRQAVVGVTSGLVLINSDLHPALVVEPTEPIARPGTDGPDDQFLPLLLEQGFEPISEIGKVPRTLDGWSVRLIMGQLHAILQPGTDGGEPAEWWRAHRPLTVTEGWQAAAAKYSQVVVFATPTGSIGRQPREDLLREALDKAAARGALTAATLQLVEM
jgi:hypothetical protein